MISDRLPDPSDLAITLSQRLAELLFPEELARLRKTCHGEVSLGVQSAAALDFQDATFGRLTYLEFRRAMAWALERYGVEYDVRDPLNNLPSIYMLARDAVHIARSHGYVVEAILDSQEATP